MADLADDPYYDHCDFDWDDTYDQDCDHEAYEIGWDGHAECDRCGERWWPPSETVTAYWEAHRRACEPPTWRDRIFGLIAEIRCRFHTWRFDRSKQQVVSDDDIPF